MDSMIDTAKGGPLDQWLAEATEAAPGVWTKVNRLFPVWRSWAETTHGAGCSKTMFTRALRRRGFEIGRLSDGAIVKGLRSKATAKKPHHKPQRDHPPNAGIEGIMMRLEKRLARKTDL